jgi:hypothetical protein
MLLRSVQALFVLTLAGLVFSSVPYAGAIAKEQCITVGQKKVCFDDGKNKKEDDDEEDEDEDNDDKPKESKKEFTCEKARCEPGMVVLDKPNKYGACCEAREGLPPPKTAEPEKCKFPGEVGTPPNCTCPPGTEFMGYKGCVTAQRVCCEGTFPDGSKTGRDCGAPEAMVRKVTESARKIANPEIKPTNVICVPAK